MVKHKNKRILIGVTGGIAAYKVPELVRRLKDRGADVRVVMSAAARAFVTPLTLQAVSGSPVSFDLLDAEAESGMGHIELARWADTVLVAPATANFMAKMAHGFADDLLSTLLLATDAETVIAPAMNQQMWQHPATAENLSVLRARGVTVLGPAEGVQACGEVGAGRMMEPEAMARGIMDDSYHDLLSGLNVVITAGPTWEAIDPVRGITNHSSGKMGYALAAAAGRCGAKVTLVSGPVHLPTPSGAEKIAVSSAEQMLEAVMSRVSDMDIFIGVAAVADYRPSRVMDQKIKKSDDTMTIELVKNPDILASVGASSVKPFTVGFAAETEKMLEHARKKRKAKNVDMIAANNVAGSDGAFGHQQNAVTLITEDAEIEIEQMDKYDLAMEMIKCIKQEFEKTRVC
ncbi:MAG: bifunctional phosphopantothenoylcysteine decarboxylase/phosphopantothenate--cysteine ligase CoaBC [Gammaproteobacteria bacterium]|nr:bifunctional phosphopantothenoylcysteine decarboxylase/phosphopantothenate--cysteine ligase CoaBC [Gammaproteobacteria bacterium]